MVKIPAFPRRLRSRRIVMSFAAVMTVATAAACGSSAPDQEASGGGSSQDDANYPVTLETAFGDVTITERPERVVALGWGDAEDALALGVQPVGASDWLDFGGEGVGPWSAGQYDEPPTIIDTMEPEYEKVAALQPDLVLDVNSSGDAQRHETLSKIAPVVAVPPDGGEYSVDWRTQMTMISKALGKPDEGAKLIGEVDDLFAQKRSEFPQFEGKEIAVGSRTVNGWGAYVDTDQRVEFAEALGFVNSPRINALTEDSFSVQVSDERIDLFDADLTVMFPIYVDPAEITEDPLLQRVPSVADGHLVVFDDEAVRKSFTTGSVPALTFALQNVPPILANALEGA